MNTSPQVARFTVAYWCVLVAALLPIVCAWIAKAAPWASRPLRVAMTTATRAAGLHARVTGAPAPTPRRPTVLIAALFHWRCHHCAPALARQTWLDLLAMLFVMLRMFYIMMYVSTCPQPAAPRVGRGVHGECRDLVRGLSLSCGGQVFAAAMGTSCPMALKKHGSTCKSL